MSRPQVPAQWVVHQTLNLKRLENLIPLSLPMGAKWELLDSEALKPTKQPRRELLDLNGEGVEMMFEGTWVRIGWPLARNSEPFKVIERLGEGVSSKVGIMFMAVLVKLGGAMRKMGRKWRKMREIGRAHV